MFEQLSGLASGAATVCFAFALGAAWIVAVAGPNTSYDRLDASRADGHIRALIRDSAAPLAAVLLAGALLSVLARHYGAAATGAVAAFGFYANRLTLAPQKPGELPEGKRISRKKQRSLAVAICLIFTLAAAVAMVLSVLGI